MSDRWESPDVAKDGSIKYGDRVERVEREESGGGSRVRGLRGTLEVFWLRQRYAAWTLVQLAGFACVAFGLFRIFGLGVYGMDGIGPFSEAFFRTIYLPGPWSPEAVYRELGWAWVGIGITIVGLSTRQR